MHADRRLLPVTTLVVAGVLATLASSGLADASSEPNHVSPRAALGRTAHSTCTLSSVDAAPAATNGEDFGTLKCSPLFGSGVQHNTSQTTPTSPTAGTIKGVAKLFFDTGTVTSNFSLKYTISGRSITSTGTATIIGGTGAYQGARGSAKLAGKSADGGSHSTFTETITATRL